ncbi:pentatricopeptide repeat-containing protein At3g29230 [Ziziphus jujuba]|uniref:Pentatricopeptide repeat-containing protein At3g29230 n=1 Tax=Ziziphus jujuba TaxID=326968 RepID=A0A6P4A1S3_ZIZJJ|nr:pentatricopeptide repeat-containing protein At3g29230 [Ziziphus jujuba]
MQTCAPGRSPSWVSRRRLLEQKISELHKCGNLSHIKQVHAQILKANLQQDLYVAPKLVAAFSLCRQLALAVNVFDQVQQPNVHLYNTLIRAHIQNSQVSQAFVTFFDMQTNGVYPDNFTYSFLLKACSGKAWFPVVQMIHTHIEKCGFCSDIFVPNSLIDSYSKCGPVGITSAKKLFELMDEKDIVSWNSMIGGLGKAGEMVEARRLFDEMPERDAVSWNTMLDGYAKAGDMSEAYKLFEKMPERNIISWSTMVSGFSKAGDMDMAKALFDTMPFKSLVPWTIIISGYAEKGLASEASKLYDQMEEAGLKPDDSTLISILAACAESGLLGLGRKVHASIERTRFKCSTQVSNALVDMYAKCGCLDKAYAVFDGIAKKDLVSWNAMLQGLGIHGHGKQALQLFARMRQEGVFPDKVTFIAILCACTHAGFVKEGLHYFHIMEKEYGITPQVEHYGCVIDLLSRGGRLDEAYKLVNSMPMEPNCVIWGTLLAACRVHNAVELAGEVLDVLVRLAPSDPGSFSMLSNIYAAAGDWGGVASVRLRLRSTGVQKPSGASLIELDNEVHEFTVFDESHRQSDKIYQMIDRLNQDLKQVGYVSSVQCQ